MVWVRHSGIGSTIESPAFRVGRAECKGGPSDDGW
jgi:hypothetical protein